MLPLTLAITISAGGLDPGAGVERWEVPVGPRLLEASLSLEPEPWGGGGAGYVYNQGMDRGVRTGLACAAGLLFPGLGHAAVGRYFPTGLAFTGAALVSLFGVIGFTIARNAATGGIEGPLTAGFASMLVVLEVVYVWSLVDAVLEAASPADVLARDALVLGRD